MRLSAWRVFVGSSKQGSNLKDGMTLQRMKVFIAVYIHNYQRTLWTFMESTVKEWFWVMDVFFLFMNIWMFPKIVGFSPQIIHVNRNFPLFSPSILGYLYFWKHPYRRMYTYLLRDVLINLHGIHCEAVHSWIRFFGEVFCKIYHGTISQPLGITDIFGTFSKHLKQI